jgi:hypothetical protein
VVFVYGPFTSRGAADRYARSRSGTGIGQPGGLYAVAATPPSNLDAQVHRVAKCLGGGGGSLGSSGPRRPRELIGPIAPTPPPSRSNRRSLSF